MSLLFPEHIRIGLGATYAVMARVKNHQVTHWQMQDFEPAAHSPASGQSNPWQNAVSAISEWLPEVAPRGARVSITLSGELALLHLLPWRADAHAAQQALLAKSHFRHVYDQFSESWEISVTPTGYGAPWLAAATDNVLLQSLKQLVSSTGAHLLTVTPLAIALFNYYWGQLGKSASWLLIEEPATLTALHLRNRQWQLLKVLPIDVLQRESIAQMLLRETRLAGLPDEFSTMYLSSDQYADIQLREPDDTLGAGPIQLHPGWKPVADIPRHSPLHLLGGVA